MAILPMHFDFRSKISKKGKPPAGKSHRREKGYANVKPLSERVRVLPKKAAMASWRKMASAIWAVSKLLCMASWGRPMSAVGTETWAMEICPRVLPPGISARL